MDYEKFLERLEKELVVTLGCTEPMAIAFAAALAKKRFDGRTRGTVILTHAYERGLKP